MKLPLTAVIVVGFHKNAIKRFVLRDARWWRARIHITIKSTDSYTPRSANKFNRRARHQHRSLLIQCNLYDDEIRGHRANDSIYRQLSLHLQIGSGNTFYDKKIFRYVEKRIVNIKIQKRPNTAQMK